MSSSSRIEKLREKRLKRKEVRKAILSGNLTPAPHSTENLSANWEKLKEVMGIKEQIKHKKVESNAQSEERLKNNFNLTKVIALDCEMVGVGPGGKDNMLARVSIVNLHGNAVYDKYVLPREPVVDYRTKVSGIRPEHLKKGEELSVVQKEISDMLKDRILVGHSLKHDFDVLFLSHPNRFVRDTSLYKPYRDMFGGRTPSLKNLALRVLELNIQEGEHSSVQDAQVAMKLYLHFRRQWEDEVKKRANRIKRKEMQRKDKIGSKSENTPSSYVDQSTSV